jgi:hypothetical protein
LSLIELNKQFSATTEGVQSTTRLAGLDKLWCGTIGQIRQIFAASKTLPEGFLQGTPFGASPRVLPFCYFVPSRAFCFFESKKIFWVFFFFGGFDRRVGVEVNIRSGQVQEMSRKVSSMQIVEGNFPVSYLQW